MTTMPDYTYDVFISYSNRDAEWVQHWLLLRLEQAALQVCIDFRDFEIGVPTLVNVERAVEQSHKTLLVLTPQWMQSEWTNFESLLLQSHDLVGTQRRLLPLMRKRCELPNRLGIFTYADFTQPDQWETQLARLLKAIRQV